MRIASFVKQSRYEESIFHHKNYRERQNWNGNVYKRHSNPLLSRSVCVCSALTGSSQRLLTQRSGGGGKNGQEEGSEPGRGREEGSGDSCVFLADGP